MRTSIKGKDTETEFSMEIWGKYVRHDRTGLNRRNFVPEQGLEVLRAEDKSTGRKPERECHERGLGRRITWGYKRPARERQGGSRNLERSHPTGKLRVDGRERAGHGDVTRPK